jgi:hypothetical protein
LRNCSGAHRMRCRIARDRHWGKLVEHPPSTRPSPPGEGEPFAALPFAVENFLALQRHCPANY